MAIGKQSKRKKITQKTSEKYGRPSKKRPSPKGKDLGQAPALPRKLWTRWLKWILETAGPKIFFVIFLTGAFGLRCGEALALKRKDINLEASIPKVIITGESKGGRKSPGDVYIRKQHVNMMKNGCVEAFPVSGQRNISMGKARAKRFPSR